jgi:non-specific serine/threonine protein kinase
VPDTLPGAGKPDDAPTQVTGSRPDDVPTQITGRPLGADDLTSASGAPAESDHATLIERTRVNQGDAATSVREPEPGHTVLTTSSRPNTGDFGVDTGGSAPISQSSWERFAMQSQVHAQAVSQVRAGHLLKGRFHLESEIGRGGMGVVFKARDERKVEAHDRNPWVAIKILNDDSRSSTTISRSTRSP